VAQVVEYLLGALSSTAAPSMLFPPPKKKIHTKMAEINTNVIVIERHFIE
jgi:hypothetical protein